MISESRRDVNEVFAHKVCINLDRRADCWVRMRARLDEQGIHDVERFAAVDGNVVSPHDTWPHSAGAYGCLLSHVDVVRDAHARGCENVLILEDDAVFHPSFQERFRAGVAALPADWDMLYLGASHMEDPLPVNDHVVRITQAHSTFAYALRSTVFDAFLAANDGANNPVDVNNLALQSRYNAYCFMPNVAWVDNSYSDIQKATRDHWYLRESLVLRGTSMAKLLAQTTLVLGFNNSEGSLEAARSLSLITQYYRQQLPEINILIVEQTCRPSLDPLAFPDCHHTVLALEGPLNRGACLRKALESELPQKVVVLSDSGVLLETQDVRGNIRLCERYDATTGFSFNCDAVLNEEPEGIRVEDRGHQARADVPQASSCQFFGHRAIHDLINHGEYWEHPDPFIQFHERHPERVFQSPNRALNVVEGESF